MVASLNGKTQHVQAPEERVPEEEPISLKPSKWGEFSQATRGIEKRLSSQRVPGPTQSLSQHHCAIGYCYRIIHYNFLAHGGPYLSSQVSHLSWLLWQNVWWGCGGGGFRLQTSSWGHGVGIGQFLGAPGLRGSVAS